MTNFDDLMERLDVLEKEICEILRQRDEWRRLYYELKESADKLIDDVKGYLELS